MQGGRGSVLHEQTSLKDDLENEPKLHMYSSGDGPVKLPFAHSLTQEVGLKWNDEAGNQAVHGRGLHQGH